MACVPRVNPWLDWAGGDSPVPAKTLVDVLFRCGEENHGASADFWDWHHESEHSHKYDIVAYRLHGNEVAP